MQNMFRMVGYGENLGSGFPLILNAWNEKHWLKPELLEQPELMQVKLTLHIQNESVKNSVSTIKLTDRQRKIYEIIKNGIANDTINAKMLSNLFGTSVITIKRDLYILRNLILIKFVGSNKTGHWEMIQ